MEDPFGNILEIYSHSYQLIYASGDVSDINSSLYPNRLLNLAPCLDYKNNPSFFTKIIRRLHYLIKP
jgi:hypothetical protein